MTSDGTGRGKVAGSIDHLSEIEGLLELDTRWRVN